MRVAVLTLGDPRERRNYSGTSFYAHQELLRRFPDMQLIETKFLDRFVSYVNMIGRRIGIDVAREPIIIWAFSRSVRHQLRRIDPDVVVSIGASHKAVGLQNRWPLIHVSDALFGTVAGYYRRYSNLSSRTLKLGEKLQQQALNNIDTLFITSKWAADDAILRYSINTEKVQVLPIGANFEVDPDASISREIPAKLQLLFVGIEWIRKGGPLTLEVFRIISREICDAKLHIVGCNPPGTADQEGVVVHGFLRKSVVEERAILDNLFQSSAIFIMPSHEEAFGLVYCEAAAHGLPAIALKTGGVPSVIADGETGLLFDEDATADIIAESILNLWKNSSKYASMRRAARARYEEKLNWNVWGNKVEAEIRRYGR